VTAGVAVGVATAFNAPIGGLLFAFEEVASFWQHSLGWQIFFACMCGVLTLNLSHSAGKALLHSGSFGWFTQDIVFEAGLEISGHILAVIPAAVVGLVCGLVGIVFTLLNLKVSRLRDLLFTGRSKWHRMAEPCILAVLYATGSMVLPLFFPCSQTQCVTFEGAVYCGLDNATSWLDSNKPPPTQPLAVPLYTCSNHTRDGGNAWIPGSGTITPDSSPANSTSTVFYNGMATLLLNTGGWFGGWVGGWSPCMPAAKRIAIATGSVLHCSSGPDVAHSNS
jgi:chloride channel 7